MTRAPAEVVYVIREHPQTALDEVVVVDAAELPADAVTILRELGTARGTRYLHAFLHGAGPAEWESRWDKLRPDRDHGPFADLLIRRRAVAYVTRERDGRTELLTIEAEAYPEEGMQVPAGRLEHGERLEEGLLRELKEETGFTGVRVVRELPDFECTYRSFSHNHAFHLVALEDTPDAWRHEVQGEGADSGLVHICRWVELTPDLELWNARDPMLAKLGLTDEADQRAEAVPPRAALS